jgi:hypothetical protein
MPRQGQHAEAFAIIATHFKNTLGLNGKRTAQTGKDTQLSCAK